MVTDAPINAEDVGPEDTCPSDDKPVVVLGAGPAGLGAAYWLAKAGKKVVVIEKEPRVGGMGASHCGPCG